MRRVWLRLKSISPHYNIRGDRYMDRNFYPVSTPVVHTVDDNGILNGTNNNDISFDLQGSTGNSVIIKYTRSTRSREEVSYPYSTDNYVEDIDVPYPTCSSFSNAEGRSDCLRKGCHWAKYNETTECANANDIDAAVSDQRSEREDDIEKLKLVKPFYAVALSFSLIAIVIGFFTGRWRDFNFEKIRLSLATDPSILPLDPVVEQHISERGLGSYRRGWHWKVPVALTFLSVVFVGVGGGLAHNVPGLSGKLGTTAIVHAGIMGIICVLFSIHPLAGASALFLSMIFFVALMYVSVLSATPKTADIETDEKAQELRALAETQGSTA